MKLFVLAFMLLAASVQVPAAEQNASPYAGQEARTIKALSEDEISSLLAGKGLGFAKSAELNGYPGPAHVLELAEGLNLSAEQLHATRTLHAKMEAQAQALGAKLVQAEAWLEELFHTGRATHKALDEALADISDLEGSLRGSHLLAHVDQHAILSPQQVAAYNRLRGYDAGTQHKSGHHH